MEKPHVDFKYAEASIKKGSKTFHFACQAMSRERRNAVYAIYAFCRHTDDLVDGNEGKPALQRMLIADWKKRLLEAYEKGFSTDPILNPFVHVLKKYDIPLRYPLDLIKGVTMDIGTKEYATFRELRRYCYRVASVVGLMLIYVLGLDKKIKEASKYAIKLGIAMQLTNILRDVGEDARMGRVYFPKDELARFGLSISDILSFRHSAGLVEFLKFQVQRARRYYEEALAGFAAMRKEAGSFIFMALAMYREILTVIEENQYEVYTKRACVNFFRKLAIYFRIVLFGYPQLQVS